MQGLEKGAQNLEEFKIPLSFILINHDDRDNILADLRAGTKE
jgi:hypothetical protein